MGSLFKRVFFPLFSFFILILGTSFFSSFVTLRLDLAGTNFHMLGMMTAVFATGLLSASFVIPFLLHKIGHRYSWILLCAMNALLVSLFLLRTDPLLWSLLRFVNGILMGGFFITIQSWLFLLTLPKQRSMCLAFYVIFYYIASSLGQLFLRVCTFDSVVPYMATITFSFLAILPSLICSPSVPPYTRVPSVPFFKNIQISFKGYFVSCIAGGIIACFYGLTPVYGRIIWDSIPDVGNRMAIITFGGLLLQLPLGKWADTWNRRKVMIFTCSMAALSSFCVGFWVNILWSGQLFLYCLFGCFSFALHPIALALSCENHPEEQLTNIASNLHMVYGAGAVCAPIILPFFINRFGIESLFYFMSVLCFAGALVGLEWRKPQVVQG